MEPHTRDCAIQSLDMHYMSDADSYSTEARPERPSISVERTDCMPKSPTPPS